MSYDQVLEPIHVGIALFQNPQELHEDLHWALVVHQCHLRARDVNIYHIRRRPSSGPGDWLVAHTTTFGKSSAADRVFPDTGPYPLHHQHSCIGVIEIGLIQVPGPDVMLKFHNWISTFSNNRNGDDPSGQFPTEKEWCSAGWVIRVLHHLHSGKAKRCLGEGRTNLLKDDPQSSDKEIDIRQLYGKAWTAMGTLLEMKRSSRMRGAVYMASIFPNRHFMNRYS